MAEYKINVGNDWLPGLMSECNGLAKLVEAVLNQVLTVSLVMRALNGWRESRYPTCTTCVAGNVPEQAAALDQDAANRQLLEEFSFAIPGFPADNGSVYINYQVAKLLESCTSSSPNLVHGTPTTTRWQNPRTA